MIPVLKTATMKYTDTWEKVRAAFMAWRDGDLEYSCEYCAIYFQTAPALFQHISHIHQVPHNKYVDDNPHFAIQ